MGSAEARLGNLSLALADAMRKRHGLIKRLTARLANG